MADLKTPQPTQLWPAVRTTYLAGAAAGDVTLTGIAFTGADRIISVVHLAVAAGPVFAAPADLTSEFSITADDTINNTGGTSSADGVLVVEWYDGDYGTTVAV